MAVELVVFAVTRKQPLLKMLCGWEPESTQGMNERGLWQMILHRSVRLSDGQSRSSTQCDFIFFCRITGMWFGFHGWHLQSRWGSLSFQMHVWAPKYMASCTILKALTTIVDTTAHLLKSVSRATADWKAQRCLILKAFLSCIVFSGLRIAHSVSSVVITQKPHCTSPINWLAMPPRQPYLESALFQQQKTSGFFFLYFLHPALKKNRIFLPWQVRIVC